MANKSIKSEIISSPAVGELVKSPAKKQQQLQQKIGKASDSGNVHRTKIKSEMQSPPQTPTISVEPTGKQQHGKHPFAAGEKRLSSLDAIDLKKEPTAMTQPMGNEPGTKKAKITKFTDDLSSSSEDEQQEVPKIQSDSAKQDDAKTAQKRKARRERRARRKSKSKSVEPQTQPAGEPQQPQQEKTVKNLEEATYGSVYSFGPQRMVSAKIKGQIDYEEAKKFLADPLIGEVFEERHITLGWQHSGKSGTAIRRLLTATIGQFRPQVDGVPIAIGEVQIIQPMFIIEAHNCMHVDVRVQMIVFKVQPGEEIAGEGVKEILCKANVIDRKAVIGTAYGNLGMTCSPVPPNLYEGDLFKARFMGVIFKNSLCQIKCAPLTANR